MHHYLNKILYINFHKLKQHWLKWGRIEKENIYRWCLFYNLNRTFLYKLNLTSKIWWMIMNLRKTFSKQRKMIFLKNVIIFDIKQTRRRNMMCQMICQKLDMVMGVSIKGTLILCCWVLTYLHPIQNLERQLATRKL